MLRLFGIPESEIAATLRAAEDERGIAAVASSRSPPACAAARSRSSRATSRRPRTPTARWRRLIRERHGDTLFSDDGSSIDEQVAALLAGPPLRTIAVAESCTGGLVTARLTERPGSSAYVLGGVTAYSNAAKADLVGVDPELIEAHGAVSPEVAGALADGAIARFGADVGVGLTGVAGPDGGTEDKPVGYVCFCVVERGARTPGARPSSSPARAWTCATAPPPCACTSSGACCSASTTRRLSGEAEPARA